MPKEPLFPHRPKSREPQFPHRLKSSILPQTELTPSQKAFIQPNWGYYVEVAGYLKGDFRRAKTEVPVKILETNYAGASDDVLVEFEDGKRGLADIRSLKPITERLSLTKDSELKHFWVEKNIPYDTWAIIEAFPGGTVRSPFSSKEEAIKHEEQIAESHGWKLKLVPSPQEKFPKQHEVLKGLYPYDILEYHDDGDLTVQSYEPLPRPKVGFKKGDIFVVTTDGKIFKQERQTQQRLPQTRKHKPAKPARDDVEIGTWAERDRMGIWIIDKYTNETVAEWWDEDAREMFDQGFFKPGDIRHQTITGRAFEDSVLDYAESVGILASGDRFLPQTVLRPKDAYYWTAVNKDTGEVVESFTPYTSSGRALRGGKAYATRRWKSDIALVEVWRQPYRYSEKLEIQPVERLTLGG